jgi:hypothetical protein
MVDPDHMELTDAGLERRLRAERPVPRAGFRAELRATLREREPIIAEPPRLRLVVAAYSVSGAALLAVAAVGLAGLGPLAA